MTPTGPQPGGKSAGDLPAPAFLTGAAPPGGIEISGRRYVTPESLAALLGVSTRTLGRWEAVRIGPPKIKVGKLVLFDLARLPEWLASRETEPVRATGGRRR